MKTVLNISAMVFVWVVVAAICLICLRGPEIIIWYGLCALQGFIANEVFYWLQEDNFIWDARLVRFIRESFSEIWDRWAHLIHDDKDHVLMYVKD